ncbi:flagellar hook capping protein [Sphingomonas ginkgonis]|uniref:Basal-body rod modification protein FlgD n=1 Tax=Sphingomonas ginkgonis TaxID=2315330 RepID=A0A429VCC8_9SPHN|nr:flagellar hook capping FlgD N-terminal domain-containing protein [Sphingomonas ginkgonis]RST31547.1 flagellar hook capping protein [Sphingomonas ginkgonis]
MTSITAVNGANIVVQPKGSAQKQLGESDFLSLMTTQLKQQDPFEPVDNQQMIAQMAQFSSLSGISQMNDTLKSIADQIGAQTKLLTDIKAATPASTSTSSL